MNLNPNLPFVVCSACYNDAPRSVELIAHTYGTIPTYICDVCEEPVDTAVVVRYAA